MSRNNPCWCRCASGGGPRRKQGATEKKSSVSNPRPRLFKCFWTNLPVWQNTAVTKCCPTLSPGFGLQRPPVTIVLLISWSQFVWSWKSSHGNHSQLMCSKFTFFLLYSLSFMWDCPDVALQQLFCIICTVNLWWGCIYPNNCCQQPI